MTNRSGVAKIGNFSLNAASFLRVLRCVAVCNIYIILKGFLTGDLGRRMLVYNVRKPYRPRISDGFLSLYSLCNG